MNFKLNGLKKVGLIDADLLDNGTRHPNLALMKISGFFKEQGKTVRLIEDYNELMTKSFDHLYMSKVFTFSKVDEWVLELDNITIGGTGFFSDGGADLPNEIEHHMPDYGLYDEYIRNQIKNSGRKEKYFSDYKNKSIGFLTRGCFRKCEFCVNKKYDRVQFHSHVNEWLNENCDCIYLWDDNILAYPQWREAFEELKETGKPFCFRQGLDIRLLNEEKAKVLATCKYKGDYTFAFDHIEDKELIENKLQLWRRHCKKGTKLYVLCGYDSIDEEDIANTFERIKILMKYGCLPYIMRYENYKNSRFRSIYVNIARWCNQPQFYKKKSFRQFCEANQDYHKNPETLCLAYSSMLEFEKEFPEIADKYFDLRYEELNAMK